MFALLILRRVNDIEDYCMKQKKKPTDNYIQLVETFITALESGKSGAELEDIRNQIRNMSSHPDAISSVENPTQADMLSQLPKENKSNNEMEAYS